MSFFQNLEYLLFGKDEAALSGSIKCVPQDTPTARKALSDAARRCKVVSEVTEASFDRRGFAVLHWRATGRKGALDLFTQVLATNPKIDSISVLPGKQ